ncbi:MAG: ABC transporter permease [Anaerolineaceae bacterium]|jgi:peptide/nickel transport system permease protein/oligopeptide transport system permease protein
MLRYIRNRILISLPTVLAVTLVVFLMLQLVPGDPAEIFLGEHFSTPQLLAEVRHQMGLDRPLYIQYLDFLWKALHGDLGRSLQTNVPVLEQIKNAFPSTLELTVAAMGISILIGVLLGVISALRHNTWVDSFSMFLALLGVSMPVYWFGLLCIFFFSVKLHWLPAIGGGDFKHLIMPASVLGLLNSSMLARMIRSSMLEVLNEDYVRTARAKGLHNRVVVMKHALRNALIPSVTVLGLQFGSMMGGAVLTETIFTRMGLGKLYVDSIMNKDLPMVQGITLIIAISYILINIAVDISYSYLDPRIRYE